MKGKNWPLSALTNHRQGQVIPLVALFLPVLIGMTGLALTVGSVYYGQAKLQNALDAAALAGAQEMSTQASQTPSGHAWLHWLVRKDDVAATHIVVQPQMAPPNTVLAKAEAQVPGTFAALFGFRTFTVRAQAVASYGAGEPFDFAVFQGDPYAGNPGLDLKGHVHVTSPSGTGANVHSNNNVYVNGSTLVEGSCGGNPSASANEHGNGKSGCQQGLIQNAPKIPMPQWTVAEATPPGATVVGSPSNPQGLTVNGNSAVNGNYVIYGNLVISGNSTVTGHYLVEDGNAIIHGKATVEGSITVFNGGIYCGGNITQSGGGILALAAFTGNGQVAANATDFPPTHSKHHHSNITPTPGSIVINGNVTVNSILYAPDSYIDLNGGDVVYGAVVGYQDTLHGTVHVHYRAAQTTAVPVKQVALIQ